MNSIFLLNESDQTKSIKEAHFNLWMVGSERFLDIGLRLEVGQKLEIYLPWANAEITDLYDTLKSGDVLNAIFNQHLTVTQTTGLGYTTVTRGTDRFDVIKVKSLATSNLKLHNTTHNNSFTKISIEPEKNTPNDSYVRIRAKGFESNVFDKKHIGTDSFVNPYRESIEAVDFRVNEIRTVTPSDFQKGMFDTPSITTLHFFLLKSFHETNSLSSPPYLRCRELEDKAWDTYLALTSQNKEAILAYHWKKEIKPAEHFSVLATFGEKKTSWLTVFFYLVIIILLNCISNFAYDKIGHKDNAATSQQQDNN